MKIFFKEFVILIFSRSNSLRLKNKYKLSVGKYDLIEKIGRKASEDFSQFSWEHFGENTSEILLNLHTDFKA